MKKPSGTGPFWAAAVVTVGVIGPVLSIRAAGAGHGTYSMARFFFPYTMILGDLLGEIGMGARILGLIQYPTYAIAGWWAASPRRHATAAWAIVTAHVAAVVGAFAARTGVFP